MGQRHQIFIKIANPAKFMSGDTATKTELKKLFGNGKYTILPFHNQWLYGRSALQSCLNVLTHCSQFDKETKTTTKGYGGSTTPFSPNSLSYTFRDHKKYIDTIAFIMNYLPVNTDFNTAGLLGAWFLGYDEPEMRNDFRMGDNNDGITIIDSIENKYCFMNINEWKDREKGERVNSASDLPYLTPVSAHDYVKCYYGETPTTLNSYYVEKEADNKTPAEIAKEFKNENAKLVRQFKKFGVLTMDEVLTMFPKVEKEISK